MVPRPMPGHKRPRAREAISEAHLTQRPSAFGALTVVRCGQRYVGRSRHGQRKCLKITENLFHVHAQCHYRRKDGRFETKQVGGESHDIDLPPHTHIMFSRYSSSALLLQRAWVTIIHPNPKLILGLPNAKAANTVRPNAIQPAFKPLRRFHSISTNFSQAAVLLFLPAISALPPVSLIHTHTHTHTTS
jgi:hypothetical protein